MAYDINDEQLAEYLKQNERPRVDMRKQRSRGRPDPRGLPDVGRSAGHGVLGGVPTTGIYEDLLARKLIQAWYTVDAVQGVADGAAVLSWPDSGPNAFTMVTDGADPTYVAHGPGDNLPSVKFDETILQRLKGSPNVLGFGWASPFTILFAARKAITPGVSSTAMIISSMNNPADTLRHIEVNLFDSATPKRNSSFILQEVDSTIQLERVSSGILIPGEAWEVYSWTYDGSQVATGMDERQNREYLSKNNGSASSGVFAALQPGTPTWLGNQSVAVDSGTMSVVYLREVIVCAPALSAVDRQALHLAMCAKWRTV